ncbi:MAG: pyridoxal-phosphate dependent enzyme [Thermomicrobiales bacterium]
MIPLDLIRDAATRVTPHLRRTPVISTRDGTLLKLENLQPTGAYKVRGFFAAALALPPEQRERGLITVSSGNAALACAYVARQLGVPCRTVMLETAPPPKVNGVRALGAVPVLLPRQELLDWMAHGGWVGQPETFLHPFASEVVMAGHGSMGLELLEQVPDLARVLIPAGGGGILVGVASALKALRPEIEVIGVQAAGYALWPQAIAANGPVQVTPATIADGTTAPFDATMLPRMREAADRWLLVPEDRLRAAIVDLATNSKVVVEGAGALAYAAREQLIDSKTTVAIVSGGNIAPKLLAELLADAA